MREIVVVGTPGSGKSTFCRLLWEERPSVGGACAEFELPSLPHGFAETQKEPFKIAVPIRNFMLCAGCALCQKSCPFGAIWEEDLWIDPFLCEGCGVCVKNCPNRALQLANMQIGEIIEGKAGERKFFSGKLFSGARGAPRLLRALRERYRGDGDVVLDVPARYGEFLAAALEEAREVVLLVTPEEPALYLLDRVSFLAPKARVYLVLNRIREEDPLVSQIKDKGEGKKFELVAEVPHHPSPQEAEDGLRKALSAFLDLAKL
ncbi:MAG: hypothetical protein GXO20_01570 [Thermodesulfobacteria bacterium]|nr:hypothetical protein [Thermodesulfobacteriota bacterium]